MQNLFIPIILGTAREGRRSEHAARYVMAEATRYGFEIELIDVRDYLFGATDDTETTESAKRYSEIISRADGLIIVSPEYNHGYPGELKQLLDSAYKEYAHKAVGICGASNGGMGGVRAVEQLRLIAIELKMVPIEKAVYFSNITTLFDEQGLIQDAGYADRVRKFFDELKWMAEALKQAREK